MISLTLPFSSALAYPTTAEDAETVVQNWLALSPSPLGGEMVTAASDELILRVEAYEDESENTIYYVVYINPKGFVIVPADDFVEPIIAFLPNAVLFDPSDGNPLGALVSADIPGRLDAVKEINRSFSVSETADAAECKWEFLLSLKKGSSVKGISSVDDERVAPLVQSKWSQSTVSGQNCYNYYTPSNYVCGCVATAMAQILRFYSYPTTGVGTGTYTIYVDGSPVTEWPLRGGDGAGAALTTGLVCPRCPVGAPP